MLSLFNCMSYKIKSLSGLIARSYSTYEGGSHMRISNYLFQDQLTLFLLKIALLKVTFALKS